MSRRRRNQSPEGEGDQSEESEYESIDEDEDEESEDHDNVSREQEEIQLEEKHHIVSEQTSTSRQEETLEKKISGEKTNKKDRQREERKTDPAAVPRKGQFFLHDDRGDGGHRYQIKHIFMLMLSLWFKTNFLLPYFYLLLLIDIYFISDQCIPTYFDFIGKDSMERDHQRRMI
jgi:hypothetical protein